MKSVFSGTAAAFILVLAPLRAAAELPEMVKDGVTEVSGEIAVYARENGIKRIAVLGFTPVGAAGGAEADSVSESVSAYLSYFIGATPAERSRVKETLAALKASGAAASPTDGARTLQELFAVEAVVTGALFPAGGDINLRAKLTDSRTGKVLFTASSGKGGVRRGDMPAPASGLPGFQRSAPAQESAAPPPPGDLRDAVADYKDGSCAARRSRLAELNAELADAKALYWAEKIRDPLFRRRTDRKNPGIEIKDPAVKARFYELLAAYFQTGKRETIRPDKLAAVLDLMESETRFFAECGI